MGVSTLRIPRTTCILVLVGLIAQAMVPSATIVGGEDVGTTAPEVVSMSVVATVEGPYASTDITAVLLNNGSSPVNHTYRFKLPPASLISNFSLCADGTVYYADVLEKTTAQERYNASVENGTTAGLVASCGDDVFAYSVSLAAGEQVELALRFEQVLLKANCVYWYTLDPSVDKYPTTVGHFEFDLEVNATTDVLGVATEGYDGMLENTTTGDRHVSACMEADNLTLDELLSVGWRTGPTPFQGVMHFGDWNGTGHFVHIFEPDPSSVSSERLPKDFIFVMDRSGSMSGKKLQQSKEALGHIYKSLGGDDRFSLVIFDDKVDVYSDELLTASEEEVAAVLDYIDGIDDRGCTDIHSAVIEALRIFESTEDPVPIMVLLTDGQANTGLYERSEFRQDVRKENKVGAAIYCIAIGNDADCTFLEKLALENNGSYIWVTESDDTVETIADFVSSFSAPLLAELDFSYAPNTTDVYPAKVRAHYIGTEVLVTGRYQLGTPMLTATVQGRGPNGDYSRTDFFDVPVPAYESWVPRAWAYRRIMALEDRMKWNGTDNATVREVIDLAVEFHFVTGRTSLFLELPDDLKTRYSSGPGELPDGDGSEGSSGGSGNAPGQGYGQGSGSAPYNSGGSTYGNPPPSNGVPHGPPASDNDQGTPQTPANTTDPDQNTTDPAPLPSHTPAPGSPNKATATAKRDIDRDTPWPYTKAETVLYVTPEPPVAPFEVGMGEVEVVAEGDELPYSLVLPWADGERGEAGGGASDAPSAVAAAWFAAGPLLALTAIGISALAIRVRTRYKGS